MPEERPPEERPRRAAAGPLVQPWPAYLISILLVFVGPGAALLARLWKRLPKRPFFASVATISVIGWPWSWTVSSRGWWSFGAPYMLGWELIEHLPLEEFLFYPLGGALCILVYVALLREGAAPRASAAGYWSFLALGSAAFALVAWRTASNGPYYLLSQLVVYNLGCGLLLAPWAARRVDLPALLGPIAALGLAGYAWDHAAFTYGWWDYHAVTGLRVGLVPVDDFNFFLYAPTAAVAIYHLWCARWGVPPRLSA